MSGTLAQDAVAALVAAARTGALPENDGPSGDGRRSRRVRRMDFTRPTKFGSDVERRTTRAMDAFTRAAATRLSAELRIPVELEVIDIDQLAWSGAHSGLPRDAMGATIYTGDRRILLAVEQPFVLAALEFLLGGGDRQTAANRRLGDIDWALSRLLIELLLSQLTPVWEDLTGLDMRLDQLDSTAETSHLASVSEPTLAITIETRMQQRSTTMVLLVPHVAVAGVIDRIAGGERDGATGEGSREETDAAVRTVEVDVRAEVARVRLPLASIRDLRPGDVLRLDAPVEAGVTVCADDMPVFRGRPGRLQARRAVQVTGNVEVAS